MHPAFYMVYYKGYHRPRKYCIIKLTMVMLIQQTKPSNNGFPPVLTSFTILVFKPIAAIAITMKNLLSSFIGLNIDSEKPICTAKVVIMDAAIKNKIKNGKICLIETFLPSLDFAFLVV